MMWAMMQNLPLRESPVFQGTLLSSNMRFTMKGILRNEGMSPIFGRITTEEVKAENPEYTADLAPDELARYTRFRNAGAFPRAARANAIGGKTI